MSNLEKLKAIYDAADQGEWGELARFHSIGFGIKGEDDAIGQVFGIGSKADANINLICQTQNMMPEILADLERLQFLESGLNRFKDQSVELKKAPEPSTEDEQEPKIRHDFTVIISGYGTEPEEAWNDAIEAFYDAPGCYDNFVTDSTDVAD